MPKCGKIFVRIFLGLEMPKSGNIILCENIAWSKNPKMWKDFCKIISGIRNAKKWKYYFV